MSGLGKLQRSYLKCSEYHRGDRGTIDTNLQATEFEVSDIRLADLTNKGLTHKFHYPYAQLGSEAKHKGKSTYIKPITATVGYKLASHKHRRVITKAEWKGRYAR